MDYDEDPEPPDRRLDEWIKGYEKMVSRAEAAERLIIKFQDERDAALARMVNVEREANENVTLACEQRDLIAAQFQALRDSLASSIKKREALARKLADLQTKCAAMRRAIQMAVSGCDLHGDPKISCETCAPLKAALASTQATR